MPEEILATKLCGRCGETRLLSRFREQKSGYRHVCKDCDNARERANTARKAVKTLRTKAARAAESPERRAARLAQMRDYSLRNRDVVLAQKSSYYARNKEVFSEKAKAKYAENPHVSRARSQQWRLSNPERKLAANKEWALNNPEKHQQSLRSSKRKRRLSASVRINDSISCQIHIAIRDAKNGRGWESIVGYSLDELVDHLGSKFTAGMTWGNYGQGWHIDHIRPVSSFDLSDDKAVAECWALLNLQPLWALDNIRKGAKLDWKPNGNS